jgi:hypothetical protein
MSTCLLLFQSGSSGATCLPAVCYSSEVVVERHVYLLAVIPMGLQWSDMSTCPLLFQWGSSGATCLPTVCYSSGVAVERHVYLPAVILVG